jgi:ribosomal protein S18 acetylase RimI-like enzyme
MTMTSLQVRRATTADADGIGLVHVRSWQEAYRGHMPDDLLDGLDPRARGQRWRETLQRLGPRDAVFVAVDPATSAVVGFTSIGEHRGEPDGAGEVYAIYVEPRAWGAGAGRALMDAAVAHLTATGPRPVRLWALDGNERARRFYLRYGFVADGTVGSHTVRDGFDVPTVRYTLGAG